MNILIIEDDIVFARNLYKVFFSQKFVNKIQLLSSYSDFLHTSTNYKIFDIVLLDINLGKNDKKSGFKILKHIRKTDKKIPIIIISGYMQYSFLEKSFEYGANDYLIKPFRTRELQIRIQRWFRNYIFLEYYTTQKVLSYYAIDYDVSQYRFYYKKQEIQLSSSSKYLFSLFLLHKEKVLSYNFLCEKIWGYTEKDKSSNLRIQILRLKQQLAKNDLDTFLQTLRGQGYIFKNI